MNTHRIGARPKRLLRSVWGRVARERGRRRQDKSHTEVAKVRGGQEGYLKGVRNRLIPDEGRIIYLIRFNL